ERAIEFRTGGKDWRCDLKTYALTELKDRQAPAEVTSTTAPSQPQRAFGGARGAFGGGRGGSSRSPDGKWTASIKDHNVVVRGADSDQETQLSKDGREGLDYGMLSWSPDSKTLVAFQIEPGENKEVYLVESSPRGGG